MTLLLALVLACGTARWEIKTLTDKDANAIDWTPQDTTIEALRAKKAPRYSDTAPRWPEERQVYRVRARALRWHREADGDIHIVLGSDDGRTIIAEVPSERCSSRGAHAVAISAARSAFISGAGRHPRAAKPRMVEVEGVLFFDKNHGQDGVAPNAVEIHPVTKWSWL